MPAERQGLVKNGRILFNIVCINIFIMMVTDSFFSVISPYLWLSDVFVLSHTLVVVYTACTAIFYIANTFFVCLLLYVIYYFGLDDYAADADGSTTGNAAYQAAKKKTDQGSQLS